MQRAILLVLVGLLIGTAPPAPTHWTQPQFSQLEKWAELARSEGLEIPAEEISAARSAFSRGDPAAADRAANMAALAVLEAFRDGCCNAALKKSWHIGPEPAAQDPATALADALSQDRLNPFFAESRPSHPYYLALADAFARESDPVRKTVLAANLNRWRWMPRDLGSRYLLVNAAAFEASLWEGGRQTGRWQVVVGRTGSPTPVFEARVTGVTINPWWEIPPRIAAEGIASLVKRNPAEARRRGYVLEQGRFRQRPGATNALGRMKLVMPNRFSVYLHDTPAQALFREDVRTFSHGCVRVGDALGLASALLGAGWDRARIDAMVQSGRTQTVPLADAMPVYITYFTAEPDEAGGIRYFPDVYHRDVNARTPGADGRCPR